MTVGPAGVIDGRFVRGVDFVGIVAAAVEAPHFVVRPVGDQRARLGILAEEVLAHVGAVARLVRLIVAVERLAHQRTSAPVWSFAKSGSQRRPRSL